MHVIIFLIILSNLFSNKDNTYLKIDKIAAIEKRANEITTNQESNIGYIKIEKLDIDNKLYNINNHNNNIEENITILKESDLNNYSIIILAAHSGLGKYAYFKNLDKLTNSDQIILVINNEELIYEVKKIRTENKNGNIIVKKENYEKLVLTTCDPKNKDKQLIIECKKINN